MVSNNSSKFIPPYQTYQQANGNKPASNTYKPPVTGGNYNPPPKPAYPGAGQPTYPVQGGGYKPQADRRVANTDTVLAAIAWGDKDKNGGLNLEELKKTAEAYKGYDNPAYEVLSTFIYGGKNGTGIIADWNKDKLLSASDVARIAMADGDGRGITTEDFRRAVPDQFKPGGNAIPQNNGYPKPQPYQPFGGPGGDYLNAPRTPYSRPNKPVMAPKPQQQAPSNYLEKLKQFLASLK